MVICGRRAVLLGLLLSSLCSLGSTLVAPHTQEHFTKAIEVASWQSTLTQKMTKEFLWCAMNMEFDAKKVAMLNTAEEFEKGLNDLINGNDEGTILEPPDQTTIAADLQAVVRLWGPFKNLLSTEVDYVLTREPLSAEGVNTDILGKLYTDNVPVLTTSGRVELAYSVAAQSAGKTVAATVLEVASRQRMLTQRMSKEAGWIYLNINRASAIPKLERSFMLFDTSHTDIVRGVGSVEDMPQLEDACTLAKMRAVNGEWTYMRPYITEILSDGNANRPGMLQIQSMNVPLLNDLSLAVTLYANIGKTPGNECELASLITKEQWEKALATVGSQRLRVREALTLFYQAAKKIQVEESKVDCSTALAASDDALHVAIEGSYTQNIPAPPSQYVVDALYKALKKFKNVHTIIDEGLREDDIAKDVNLTRVEVYTAAFMEKMDYVADLYVNASLMEKSTMRSVIIEISLRQQILIQQMHSSALLVSLRWAKETTASGLENFWSAFQNFEASHVELLQGRTVDPQNPHVNDNTSNVTVLFTDRSLTKVKNGCILSLMMDVLKNFDQLKHTLYDVVTVVHEAEKTEYYDPDSKVVILNDAQNTKMTEDLLKASSERLLAEAPMRSAAAAFVSGTLTCNTQISKAEWESGLQLAGKTQEYLQKATEYFALLTSGAADIWMANADAALNAQLGYIADDIESPVLATAVVEFKEGWFALGKDDTEREFALKTAYITQNPHPVGSKFKLDYAPGTAEYHVAHKQYHTVYRDLLVARNYNDAYIFDPQGNLVYSVNKEADFATNFAAKGDGPWKNSGLGEAYEKARKDTTETQIIAWAPYGPAGDALASFLSKAILSPMNAVLGVYATQMPPEAQRIDCAAILRDSIYSLDKYIKKLKFGVYADEIAPPPTQAIADSLFAFEKKWSEKKEYLEASTTVEHLESVLVGIPPIVGAAKNLMQQFVDDAWAANPLVPGAKIAMASEQIARIQSILKDVALFSMESMLPEPAVTADEILALMKEFEDNHAVLVEGRTSRRLAGGTSSETTPVPGQRESKEDILPSTDPMIVKLLEDTANVFETLKSSVTSVVAPAEGEENGGPSTANLRALMDVTSAAAAAMEQSLLFVASKMEIIVLTPISILSAMPLTGSWDAGKTMRLSARVAEAVINDDGIILPGYAVSHVFFDDKCDTTQSTQIVLEQMKSLIKYVALGGSGCSSVCAGTAFVASSIGLPYLSYDCPGPELSDTTLYPDLTRFGTVTTPKVDVIQEIGETFADWTHVAVISGDPGIYRTPGEQLVSQLTDKGLPSDYGFAYDAQWEEIVGLVDSLRMLKRRVIFVMGSESYFRKIICASMVVAANKGITWLSEGSWREHWWQKGDLIIDTLETWVTQDSTRADMKEALVEFKKGWIAIGTTDEERAKLLQPLYITDLKGELMFVAGDEKYHTTHREWHPMLQKTTVQHKYADIYLFDLKGNMIYSVDKEIDYGTNFGQAKNLLPELSEWQNSGLGDAFKAAVADPGTLATTTWDLYGPNDGALASFMAIAIMDENANPLGVLGIQLPQEAMSIETVEPQCTLAAITDSFEGAINFVGLGQPIAADMEKQVDCFKGMTARTFMEKLDGHLASGFPTGDASTVIPDPYNDVRMHAADGTCVIAYTVSHLLGAGFTLWEIENNQQAAYTAFIHYVKHTIDIQGVSGVVKFVANDKPAFLAVQQVREGVSLLVGTCSHNSSVDLTINGGPSNASWNPAFPDVIPVEAAFPYWVFQIVLPILCICCPGCAALIRNF
jgi:hypothetical protein